MKPTLCVLAVAATLFTTPDTKAMFGHVAAERERRIEIQQQLEHQQQTTARLYIVVSILSAGVVVALLVGTAVGSKHGRNGES